MAGPPEQPDTAAPGGPPSAPAPPGLPAGPAIPPLNVTGLVVAKADLLAALRIYVPYLAHIPPLDSERYLLSLTPPLQETGE